MSTPAPLHARLRRAAVLVAAAGSAACASGRPESHMSVTTPEGRLVPFDSVTTSFRVGGVQVLYRPNFANDVVAVHLYLLGGTRQLTPATQGIESLLLQLGEYGSMRYPGDTARLAWELTGSELEIDAESDFSLYGFRGLRADFDSSWAVWADRLMHPTLGAKNVAVVRARLQADARQIVNEPDDYVYVLADSAAFGTHPYALQPDGTEQSLATIDSAALRQYLTQELVTSRLLLVVVGNVSRAMIEHAVSGTLATLPAGQYAWSLPPRPQVRPSGVVLRQRPVSTNYILGLFQGPPASAPDYAAFRVATALLSARIGESVREQHALSYAASAPFLERGIATGGIYVTTVAPARVLPMIRSQIDSLRKMDSRSFDIHYFTDQFILDYLAENSTDDAQASFLARAQLYEGDYHRATQEMEELRRVAVYQVRAAADRYIRNVQFAYVGDTTRVQRSAFTAF